MERTSIRGNANLDRSRLSGEKERERERERESEMLVDLHEIFYSRSQMIIIVTSNARDNKADFTELFRKELASSDQLGR